MRPELRLARHRAATLLAALRREQGGLALVEFALTLPILLTLYLCGYQIADAIACNRKVTVAARSVADLVSQYPVISEGQIQSILDASTQVMAPYSASNATVRVSEISTDNTGLISTVTWSRANDNGTPFQPGTPFTLPTGIRAPNSSYILGEVYYTYTPLTKYGIKSALPLGQTVFMVPRVSTSIPIQ